MKKKKPLALNFGYQKNITKMNEEKKQSWGGKRPGSGAKKKEETETTGFRINSEALNICRAAYGRTLNKHVNDFVKRLAKKAGKGSS